MAHKVISGKAVSCCQPLLINRETSERQLLADLV
jgi:hypothetical protein